MHLSGTFHVVKRNNIFNSVNDLLKKEGVLSEYLLKVKFDGEAAFDSGGVCKDMFSAYWEEGFKNCFDGNSILTPVIHQNIDMPSLPMLGTVLSVSAFLSTRIVFPSLACILLGTNIEVPSHILVDAFVAHLSDPLSKKLLM